MIEYKGYQVDTAYSVDVVTGNLIEAVTGGGREEMKMHRQAIKALSVLAFADQHTPDQNRDAQVIAQNLEVVDKQIERIIEEGKQFKAAHGLV